MQLERDKGIDWMSKRLEAMRRNPRGDWTIADVKALCREFGIFCEPLRGGGSHYKIAHPQLPLKLTIPFKRPIKPVYVKQLVAFADTVRNLP
ncbi:MAG TPA: type II toxin-antitoxin system HicA family toxin [Aestuariivirga sp.]|nr:type II toxin-antitoxin system HicA family toxin [Aestuariivirga sp.]